jgi:hypothetical protein
MTERGCYRKIDETKGRAGVIDELGAEILQP